MTHITGWNLKKSSINPQIGPITMSIQFASSIVVCLIIAPILFSSTSKSFNSWLSATRWESYTCNISYMTLLYLQYMHLLLWPKLYNTSLGQRCQFTLSSAGYILYAIANLWPSWYTMVPSAIILGFATGISWAGATLFIPTLATDTGLTAPLLYSIFTGIVQVRK